MGLVRSLITTYFAGGISRDNCTNTVYHTVGWDMLALAGTDWQNHATEILALFNGTMPSRTGFALYKDRHIEVRCYDMSDAEPRPEKAFATNAHTGAEFGNDSPTELAAVLSYYAGRNIPGLRGRLYIGPLQESLITTGGRKVSDTVRNMVIELGHGLFDIGGENVAHVLHHQGIKTSAKGVSPATYGPTKSGHAPGSTSVITDYSVSDAWGVQRRRGLRPTSRVTLHP